MKILVLPIIASLALLCYSFCLQAQPLSPHWGKKASSPDSSQGEYLYDMVTDKHGNSYVLMGGGSSMNIGGNTGSVNSQMVLTSWDCNGNFRWMKSFGGNGTISITSVEADTLEGIYLSGRISVSATDSVYFDSDTVVKSAQNTKRICLLKYSSLGQLQWYKNPYLGNSANSAYNVGLSVSPAGNVFWIAHLSPGIYDGGAFVVNSRKHYAVGYTAGGTYQSATPLDMNAPAFFHNANSHWQRDHAMGRFYAAFNYIQQDAPLTIGSTSITPPVNAFESIAVVAAFDHTGKNIWVRQASPNKFSALVKPIVSGDGTLFIGGDSEPGTVFMGDTAFNALGTKSAPFLMAIDTAGKAVWVKHAGIAVSSFNVSTLSTLSYANNILLATGGYNFAVLWDNKSLTSPVGGGGQSFMVRLNAAAGMVTSLDSIWADQFCDINNSQIDKNSNIYIGGIFFKNIVFGTNLLNTATVTYGYTDAFIAKFKNVNCNCNLLQPAFSYTPTTPSTFSFSYTGGTPYTNISWNFGDGSAASTIMNPTHTYAASGNYAVCVTVTNGCGANTTCHYVSVSPTAVKDVSGFENLIVYPNPASQSITIKNAEKDMVLEIYNVVGGRLMKTGLTKKDNQINVSHLSAGVYLLRFTDRAGKQVSRRFVKE